MRRLFRPPPAASDARPALFAVAALMLLVVPAVLLASTGQRLTGLGLALAGPEDDLPPLPPGPVEELRVQTEAEGFRLQVRVRRTDVRAQAGAVEEQEFLLADLAALQQQLGRVKALDPGRRRLSLRPHPESTAEELVRQLDALRQGPQGELFPEVIVEADEP